jgi:hypothetical protein
MSEFSRNLFWNQTHAVPLSDSANGDIASSVTHVYGRFQKSGSASIQLWAGMLSDGVTA